MKNLLPLVCTALLLTFAPVLLAQSHNDPSQVAPGDRKTKMKGDKIVLRDKSKPVRKAIEAWYARNVEAFMSKDVSAVMALRTDDFHAITPDRKLNTRVDMRAYTQRFLGMIDHFISLEFQIGTIEVDRNLASANVTQRTVRMQRMADGLVHKVEARAIQRETWKKTSKGWLMYRVENVRSDGVFVDDKPFQPTR